MLENKIFEVRDRATFMPVLCTKMAPGCIGEMSVEAAARETKLLRKTGYDFDFPLILFTVLGSVKNSHYDPYHWGDRTLHTAHAYIAEHFDEMETGAVVDVEYILGEKPEPKTPEV